MERWKQHIDEHLNAAGIAIAEDQGSEEMTTSPNYTISEVEDAIQQHEINRAANKDGFARCIT